MRLRNVWLHAIPVILVLTCPARSLSRQADQPAQELINDIITSIALKGCNVFEGNELRQPAVLRDCYAASQDNPQAAALIKATPPDSIKNATFVAVKTIRDVYRVEEHFDWVMGHEGQLQNFVALAKKGDFRTIREIYRSRQEDRKVHNLLSALSDAEIQELINQTQSPAKTQVQNEIPKTLVDHVSWAISYGGCNVFAGESLRKPETLKECYLSVEEKNHNGEAFDQINQAPSEFISLATERAIAEIKDSYDLKDTFETFLTHSGLLEQMAEFVQEDKVSEIRLAYVSSRPPDAEDRYLLNVLADSEIKAIVNLPRFTVFIPPDTPPDKLESFSKLLRKQTIDVSHGMTVDSLAALVCSNLQAVPGIGISSENCKQIAINSLQGVAIDEHTGEIVGPTKVDIPILPPVGVPTRVTLREGATSAQIASDGIKSEELHTVYLIRPEQNVSLAADTKANNKDDGRSWFAYSISADKVRRKDLALNSTIHIGIVDAGVDINHASLKPFFWELPFVFPRVKWTKGSVGYDYLKKVSDPTEGSETEWHGTHITGLVTARALAGWLDEFRDMKLEEHLKVYSLKVAGQYDIPDFCFPSQALYEAILNGIHLFNLSLKGPESGLLRDQIDSPQGRQALIIVAAGNDGIDMNKDMSANGTFRKEDKGNSLDNVIIVAALMDAGNHLTPKSNRGALAVEIAAPGNNIYSTIGGGSFGVLTGTSQAAPLVTSTAAILLSERSDAYPSQVKERILATCDWADALKDFVAEGCELNMAKAIIFNSDAIELNSVTTTNPPTHKWLYGSIVADKLQIKDESGNILDPARLHRIWFLDANGKVKVAVRGGTHMNASLSTPKVVIKLEDGEQCPGGTIQPCEVELKDIRDVVFRWTL
jgi:subtilisin family serine protease